MKTLLYCIVFAFIFIAADTFGQCGRISLIGEFNSWSSDEFLDRDPVNPEEFTLILVLTTADDYDGNGIIEMKFRENSDWAHNYGSNQFPSGTGILNGLNIPVPVGSYLVTFNCNNLHYNFQSTCGQISLIGEFNGWTGDIYMTRDPSDPDLWTADMSLDEGSNSYDPPNIIEMKFRENSDWMINWGDNDFPSGTGILNGENIPVPLTSTGITTDYHVTFNCSSGAFNFIETSGQISLYGEFSDWTGDYYLERDDEQFDIYSGIISLKLQDDSNGDGLVEMKFRENADLTVNWGSTLFPSGTAVPGGANIQVPLDNTGVTTDYLVTFNYNTLAFSFQATSGDISIIGAFIGWNGDIPMNREPGSPDNWTLTRCWYANSDVKFRENNDWTMNWGNSAWPSGTGLLNGPNIPLIGGTYDVSFNALNGAYNFVANPDACGEIGMVGDFNGWGEGGGFPTDIYLLRDPVYPSRFSIDYSFTVSTGLLFRLNADPDFTDVWGGSSLCQTGVQDETSIIAVDPGYYHITFDHNSGDYCLIRLDNSVLAPKTFSMNIDGTLDEPEWDLSQQLTRVIDGTPGPDPNQVNFGVVYSNDFLYVGIEVTDAILTINDANAFFIDGDQSGGEYDEHDVYFIANGPVINVIIGPPGGIYIASGLTINENGYNLEVAIPLGSLGVSPAEGEKAGFDLFNLDDDTGSGFVYIKAWNGNLLNEFFTSFLGELVFGPMSWGNISLYNDVLGDIMLHSPSNQPETFLGTYDFDNDFDVVFRKDKTGDFFWGGPGFPTGIAEPGGPPIPVAEGRYRINFNCETGEYIFSEAPAGENVAMATFNEEPPVIDGQVDEYDLFYNSNILAGSGGPINNVVNWGAIWDMQNIYIGVRVTDEAIFGSGSPWDNDAIEFYIDGNNDKDGPYDLDFDTQIIMDALNQSVPWFKADGVPITNYEAQWGFTGLGYNVELRLGWDNFDFEPGRGRVMGWSLANDDNDFNAGRDYQSVWYGNENNWNNTYNLGDLQLADGPYTVNVTDHPDLENVLIYPNPSCGQFYIRLTGKESGDHIRINVSDISGRIIAAETDNISSNEILVGIKKEQAGPGLYIVHIYSDNGDSYTRKLIIY